MGEERVILKDGVDGPVVGGDALHRDAANEDFAGGRLFEAGDKTQRRRLAAAAWSQQREELAIGDLHADMIDRADLACRRIRNP